MMDKMKIGFFGDGPWSHLALEKLLLDDTIDVQFICARHESPDEVLRLNALKNDLAFTSHQKVNSQEFISWAEGYDCDIFVSMSFNQIFSKALINLPPLKIINCHAGKLPYYRGRNILNWALINDEKEFGITVHFVDEGIDTGDIIAQSTYPITDQDDYQSLLNKAYQGCSEVLYNTIKSIQSNSIIRVKQKNIHPHGSYCVARVAGDEILNWNQSSRDVFNFIRAISSPGPSARTFLHGAELKINKALYLPGAPTYHGVPGSVLGWDVDGFIVKTVDSYIKVIEWSGSIKPKTGDRLT